MDDVPAVLDAVEPKQANVITTIGGGIMATVAAAHPERVASRCAMRDATAELGTDLRTEVHRGEVEGPQGTRTS